MVGGVLVYVVVVRVLMGGRPGVFPADTMAAWRWPLYGVGAALLVGLLLLKPRLMSGDALAEVARREGARAALQQLQTRLVVLLAVADLPAIWGLVFFLLGGGLSDFYALWTASILGLVALTPRRELWDEVARHARRA